MGILHEIEAPSDKNERFIMSRTFSSNLSGKVRNFSLPKGKPLVPLYEAVVNSINAIDERVKKYGGERGHIDIQVVRDSSLLEESDGSTIQGFIIRDDGIGFDEENMNSFMEADSEHKAEIGGKGVGRFSWLKVFSSVHIKSVYRDRDVALFHRRIFDFSLDHGEIDDTIEDLDSSECIGYCTEIEFLSCKNDYVRSIPQQLEKVALRIVQHCLLYFLRDSCPEITISDSQSRIVLNEFFRKQFSTNESTMEFEICGRRFRLLNVKITDKSFSDRNKLYLCANERLVETRDLERMIVNLDASIFEKEKYWYLGVLTSDYFDENVDMNRLCLNIEAESSEASMFPEYPGLVKILDSTCLKIQEYLGKYLDSVETSKLERFREFFLTSPQYRHLEYYAPDKLSMLKPNLSDSDLDDALYGIKREIERSTKKDCDELSRKLRNKMISSQDYQRGFQKIAGKVNDVNTSSLVEYVVHRRTVLNLFKNGLEIRHDGTFNPEKYMHDLIYPMRSTSEETPYDSHNLWLIDDRLSFCHFLTSDKPFGNSKERPDILILDKPAESPIAVVDRSYDGTVYSSITIIELKRPGRDNYDGKDNPIKQLTDYVRKFRNGELTDCNKRPIKVDNSTQFYLYAVCDLTPSLRASLEEHSFTITSDDLGAFFYNQAFNAYFEVLSYDKIRNDAEKRNKAFFDKLGITNF